jgi:hypothetical protein
VSTEPRLRVFLIRIYGKSWIRQKIVRRPLPNVAEHLAAAKSAVAGLMGTDLD